MTKKALQTAVSEVIGWDLAFPHIEKVGKLYAKYSGAQGGKATLKKYGKEKLATFFKGGDNSLARGSE